MLFLHAEEDTDSRDNLSDQTIHSLLSGKINNTTECHQYKPDTDVVKAAKKACIVGYYDNCVDSWNVTVTRCHIFTIKHKVT